MTDIFASLQTYMDTQAAFPVTDNASEKQSTDGILGGGEFADLIDRYVSQTPKETPVLMPELMRSHDGELWASTFSVNNSFVKPVIDMLAGNTELPDSEMHSSEMPDVDAAENKDTDSYVFWPDDANADNPADLVATAEFHAVNFLAAKVKNFVSENLQNVNFSEFANGNMELADIEEFAEQLINSSDFAEIIDSLPEEMKQEISRAINEIAQSLKNEDGTDNQNVAKLLDAVSARITRPAKKKEEPEISKNQHENFDGTDLASFGVMPSAISDSNVPSDLTSQEEKTDEHSVIPDALMTGQKISVNSQPLHSSRAHAEPKQQDIPSGQAGQEGQKAGANFREVLADRNIEREPSGDGQPDSQNQNQEQEQNNGENAGQNFSQSQDNYSGSHSASRSRNDSRRTDSKNQAGRNDSSVSSASSRRTESHNDFAAYFEGVLTSRRSTSKTSALPLNLRSNVNYTQSSGLRDGITNVVRFIRADGLRKASIIVDPPALGRISVELTTGTSGVEASIKVASEQIRQLVQDQLSQLRMNLSQQGVQVAEFTVDVQQDNSGHQNPQGKEQEYRPANFFDSIDDDETEEFRIDLEDGLLYWVA